MDPLRALSCHPLYPGCPFTTFSTLDLFRHQTRGHVGERVILCPDSCGQRFENDRAASHHAHHYCTGMNPSAQIQPREITPSPAVNYTTSTSSIISRSLMVPHDILAQLDSYHRALPRDSERHSFKSLVYIRLDKFLTSKDEFFQLYPLWEQQLNRFKKLESDHRDSPWPTSEGERKLRDAAMVCRGMQCQLETSVKAALLFVHELEGNRHDLGLSAAILQKKDNVKLLAQRLKLRFDQQSADFSPYLSGEPAEMERARTRNGVRTRWD